jgi:hypothetical protein
MNSREVRLILIENVPGISMQNLNPSNFTKLERQTIMKAIIDSETALYNREIVHETSISAIYWFSLSHPIMLEKSFSWISDYPRPVVPRSRSGRRDTFLVFRSRRCCAGSSRENGLMDGLIGIGRPGLSGIMNILGVR